MTTFFALAVLGQVLLDPAQRSLTLDLAAGTHAQTEVVSGRLQLARTGSAYATSGTWTSPVYDTRHAAALWEWLSATTTTSGQQQLLMPNGGFENVPCGQRAWWPIRLPQNAGNTDCTTFSEGTRSMSIVTDETSRLEARAYLCGPIINPAPGALVNVTFDLQLDTQVKPLVFGLNIPGSMPPWKAIASFEHPLPAFTEQSYAFDPAQLGIGPGGFSVCFWTDYAYGDRPLKAWVDDVRVYQSSPVSFRARSSADGSTWSTYTEPRFFLQERTAPGAPPARFFQLELKLTTQNTSVTPTVSGVRLDYTRAFTFPVRYGASAPSPIDPVVEPVGTHGRVRRTPQGHFAFADGTPVRFWATQVGDSFALTSAAESDAFCARLARFGFNLLKLTPPPAPDTRFDQLLASCARNGVYIALQLNGGNSSCTRIVPSCWWNLEQHVTTTLGHVNPLRGGLALKDDPQLVMVQLFNEETMLTPWANSALPPNNPTWLDGDFQTWLQRKYGTTASLATAWNDGSGPGLDSAELGLSPGDFSRVRRYIFDELDANDRLLRSDARFRDGTRYHAGLWKNAFDHFMAFMPDAGVQALVVGNNHYYGLAEVASRAGTDVLDHHPYFDNIEFPTDTQGEWIMQVPQSRRPHRNMVTENAQLKLKGRPLISSESNDESPHLYGAELPLFVSSYWALQDWDDWTLFILSLQNPNTGAQHPYAHVSGFDPVKMFQMPAASRIFRDALVRPASKEVELTHTEAHVNDYKASRRFPTLTVAGLSNAYAQMHRISRAGFDAGVEPSGADYERDFALSLPAPGAPYVSDTRELALDSVAGALRIDAPKAQGFVGFTPAQAVQLSKARLSFTPSASGYAAVSLVALDGRPLETSAKVLVTAVGRAENTGMQWDSVKTGVINPGAHNAPAHHGGAPVWVEGINVAVELQTGASAATLRALDPDGQRGAVVPLTLQGGMASFALAEGFDTVWYLLEATQPVTADAGTPIDAGSSFDAGVWSDAGSSFDAGVSSDAGSSHDAGVSLDAGAIADAGHSPPDSGTADAGELLEDAGKLEPIADPTADPVDEPRRCGCTSGAPPLLLSLLALARRRRVTAAGT